MTERDTLGSEFLDLSPADEALEGEAFARRVVSYLVQASREQSSIVGIYGRWGSGKTHALNRIGVELLSRYRAGDTPGPVLVCCFRAWEFEAEGDLAVALIRSLAEPDCYPIQQLGQDSGFLPDPDTARDLAARLAWRVLALATGALPVLGGFARDVVEDLVKTRAEQAAATKPPLPRIKEIQEELKALVDKVLPNDPDSRLVVLVDDLDRCAPPNVVRLFKWFKNHLYIPRCQFVVAIDHRMAAKAIVGHYRDYAGDGANSDYGFRYLEKLFEFEFELQPDVGSERMALLRLGMAADTLAQWARLTRGQDFPGERDIPELLHHPALWVPRTMLRIVQTYRAALEAIMEQGRSAGDRSLLSNDLEPSFPYWLLLLCVLHHSFPPDEVEAYVEQDKRPVAVGGPGEAPVRVVSPMNPEDYRRSDPRHSLLEYLRALDRRAALGRPPVRQMQYLYRIVKEKMPIPLRPLGLR